MAVSRTCISNISRKEIMNTLSPAYSETHYQTTSLDLRLPFAQLSLQQLSISEETEPICEKSTLTSSKWKFDTQAWVTWRPTEVATRDWQVRLSQVILMCTFSNKGNKMSMRRLRLCTPDNPTHHVAKCGWNRNEGYLPHILRFHIDILLCRVGRQLCNRQPGHLRKISC